MSPRDNTVGIASRRRPSLSLRPRPRTAAYPIALPKEYTFDQWQKASLVEACDDDSSAFEEMEPFPEAVPRRRTAKSFSSLRHPMDGLVALGRRLSVTLRNRSSKQNLRVQGEEQNDESRHYHHATSTSGHKRNAASGSWGMRSRAWSHGPNAGSINRRPSLNSPSALHGFYVPTASIPAPIPGYGLEPPILPNDIYAGAAARAAAAAQNEQMELARLELAKTERDLIKGLPEMRLTQDSESGIGIDLRDPSEISDSELDIVRLGMIICKFQLTITAH
jgi:F-box and WD-40 domain protein 1/11